MLFIKNKWNHLSNNDFLDILKNLYEKNPKNITQSNYREIRKKINTPSITSYLNRFNTPSWTEVLRLAGIKENKINTTKKSVDILNNSNKKIEFPQLYLMSGIYKITNIINGKIYIGSTVNLYNRFNQHINELRKNTHNNPHLQFAWNKYKEHNFVFEVIECVDKNELLQREQYWLDYYKSYDPEIGYNICKIAGNCLGITRSEKTKQRISKSKKGIKKSEKTKQRMRRPKNKTLIKLMNGEPVKKKKRKEKPKEQHIIKKVKKIKQKKTLEEIHKQRSESQRGSNNPNAKLTELDILKIKEMLTQNIKIKKIAEFFNVSSTTISDIKANKKWKHVKINESLNYINDQVS